jgi:hypothetical protein
MPLHHQPAVIPAHSATLRFLHWVWVYAVGCMVFSGWEIYNASPSLPFSFPSWTGLGGWLGGALAWHFSAMWLLALDAIAYLVYGFLSGHFRRELGVPTPGAFFRDFWSALTFRLGHRIGHYNAVQRVLYLGVIGALVHHRSCDLEASAAWRVGRGVWRLPDRTQHSSCDHVPYRGLRSRPPHTGGHFPSNAGLDDRKQARRTGEPNMKEQRRLPVVRIQDIRPELRRLERRALLRNALSLGGLALLTGCDLSTNSGVDAALKSILRLDDKVQAALFSGRRLAQSYPPSAVTRPFRFNAYYAEWQVRAVPDGWRLEVAGLVSEKTPWTMPALRRLPQVEQITRHICIEGWSQIGRWSGVPLRDFLQRIGADLRASFVSFKCFDGYSTSVLFPDATLTAAVAAFQKEFPATQLRFDIESSAVIEPVLDGLCAIGVVGSWALAPPQLTREKLLTVRGLTVVSAQHPLAAHRGQIPLTVLAEHIKITHTDPSDVSRGYESGSKSPRVWRLSHLGAKLAFLRAGFGFGRMPLPIIEADLASGRLVEITTENAPRGGQLMEMWAIYRTDSPPGPAGRWFVDRLKREQTPLVKRGPSQAQPGSGAVNAARRRSSNRLLAPKRRRIR